MTTAARQPIFNAPTVIVALIGAFALVHGVREFLLDEAADGWLLGAFAFIPARYGALAAELPGSPWAAPGSFLTHAFLHGDLMHLAVNSAWLLAVGTPLARRLGAVAFLLFFALAACGGAVLFLALKPDLEDPMIGASGAISGLMAAVFRLLYAAGDADGFERLRQSPQTAAVLSLGETFTNRGAVIAIAVWVGVNLLLAVGLGGTTASGGIAWQAHLGGFFTGLMTFDLFDGAYRRRSPGGGEAT